MFPQVNIKPEDVDSSTLRYAIDYESAYKPTDYFIRRTGALFFDISWVQEQKNEVIQYMAETLGWSKEQKQAYTAELEQALYDAAHPEE